MTCDTASVLINKPAEDVFAFMADPQKLDLWSFGTWKTTIDSDGLVHGHSMFDGSSVFVRVEAHKSQLLIDYHVGNAADSLVARIFARVTAGHCFSHTDETCLLTLTAIRGDTMNEARWSSLKSNHAVEVNLVKSLIESGHDHRQ